MGKIKNNIPILVCLLALFTLTDNIALIMIKLMLEVVVMAGLFVIITAINFIREKEKPYGKPQVVKELDEVFENAKKKKKN